MPTGDDQRADGVLTDWCGAGGANTQVDSARSLLNNMLPDVYIYTDHYRGPEGGLSPGPPCTFLYAAVACPALLVANTVWWVVGGELYRDRSAFRLLAITAPDPSSVCRSLFLCTSPTPSLSCYTFPRIEW